MEDGGKCRVETRNWRNSLFGGMRHHHAPSCSPASRSCHTDVMSVRPRPPCAAIPRAAEPGTARAPLPPPGTLSNRALCSAIFSLENCCEEPNSHHFASCNFLLSYFLKVGMGWASEKEAAERSRENLLRAQGFQMFSPRFCRLVYSIKLHTFFSHQSKRSVSPKILYLDSGFQEI